MQESLNLELLPSDEYLVDLQNELAQNPSEIRILSFHISAQSMMLALLPGLNLILESGGKVEIFADAEFSTFNFTDKVWLFLNSKEKLAWNKDLREKTLQIYADLQSKGATIKFNQSNKSLLKKILPVYRSDHRKIVTLQRISGERIAYFGGINLDDGGKNDFMVKTSDPELAEMIHENSSYFGPNLPNANTNQKLKSDNFEILFDIGKPFSSIIMDAAKEMISGARNQITYITHLPPEFSVLLQFIKAGMQGVNVNIILPIENDPHLNAFPYNIIFKLSKLLLKITKSNINIEHLNSFTHAKVLIADEVVLVGSHNLSSMGVVSGIKEFSVKIKDLKFLTQIQGFIDSLK